MKRMVVGDLVVDGFIRFLLSAPVLSIFCVPSGLAQVWMTPRVPYFLRISGFLK